MVKSLIVPAVQPGRWVSRSEAGESMDSARVRSAGGGFLCDLSGTLSRHFADDENRHADREPSSASRARVFAGNLRDLGRRWNSPASVRGEAINGLDQSGPTKGKPKTFEQRVSNRA